MATYNKFQPFVEALAEKVHNLGSDTLKIFLTNTLPLATYGTLSQITEISYSNLSSRTITQASSTQTSGTYKLVLNDLTLTANGTVPTFRYIGIYNDTATNDELICWYDYGSSVSMIVGDSIAIDIDGTNGVLQIA